MPVTKSIPAFEANLFPIGATNFGCYTIVLTIYGAFLIAVFAIIGE
jgi:hypothetical protein